MSFDGVVVSIFNVETNTAVDLTASRPDNETPIIGYKYHGGPNQHWKFVKVQSDGLWPIFKLQSVATGTFIDLYNGGSKSGTPINGWRGDPKDTQNQHQLWRIVTADPSADIFRIQNVGTGTYIDLADANSGTKITGEPGDLLESNTRQIWKAQRH